MILLFKRMFIGMVCQPFVNEGVASSAIGSCFPISDSITQFHGYTISHRQWIIYNIIENTELKWQHETTFQQLKPFTFQFLNSFKQQVT